MDGLSAAYRADGCTAVVRVVDEAELAPLQALVWELTSHLLPEDARLRPLAERLRLPFTREPAAADLARLMNTVQASDELRQVGALPGVGRGFRAALGCEDVEPFPICRFRAQIPGVARSSVSWHQDEGTWYAVRAKGLAYRAPATLWLSLNGAEAGNSIELIPRSHALGLVDHRFRRDQGYFDAVVPECVAALERRRVEARAGEGMFFHALTLHRSVPARTGPPRYSVDLRGCARGAAAPPYRVDWRLRARRWLTR